MSDKINTLLAQLQSGDRFALSRSITLIESDRPDDRASGIRLLAACEKLQPKYTCLAITGSPGVGKSTFIEKLGKSLIAEGKWVAVLAIDPASSESQGSILGDKTRMPGLSQEDRVYIRPSSNRLNYGGVAPSTWESMLLCATAGYNHILIETVGVGQSEIDVAQFSDVVLMLLQPGAGDELQSFKRGILEIAHLLIITKNDGEQVALAEQTFGAFKQHLIRVDGWQQALHKYSAYDKDGLHDVLQSIDKCLLTRASNVQAKRNVSWLKSKSEAMLLAHVRNQHQELLDHLTQVVKAGNLGPVQALQRFISNLKSN